MSPTFAPHPMPAPANAAAPAHPRPMRRAKREVTDADALRAIVDACRTVRLGLVDAEGMFIVPMNFGYDWDASAMGAGMGAGGATGTGIAGDNAYEGGNIDAVLVADDAKATEASGPSAPAGTADLADDEGKDLTGATPRPRLTLWLHSAGEGRKADAFRAGGDAGTPVAIEMDVEDGVTTGDYACAYSFAYRSIMGTGRAHVVTDADEKLRGLRRIMEHLAPGAPVTFSREAVERVSVLRVDVERLSGKQRV